MTLPNILDLALNTFMRRYQKRSRALDLLTGQRMMKAACPLLMGFMPSSEPLVQPLQSGSLWKKRINPPLP